MSAVPEQGSPEAVARPADRDVEAPSALVIGGGPAGLMAAERLVAAGCPVRVYDAMPSVGRKFLLAGKGGLNLTHGEPIEAFTARYRERAPEVGRWLQGFGPAALREWAAGLGIETFVGSSGRVFPQDLKAAPLLRAWLHRLRERGVRFYMRRRWQGWGEDGRLRFSGPDGVEPVEAAVTVLALGGASWPQLGADGRWVEALRAAGAEVSALRPANCGFELRRPDGQPGWSAYLRQRYAGAPIKTVALHWTEADGRQVERVGDFVLSDYGVEGSLIYAASAACREAIARDGVATPTIDLLPAWDQARVQHEVGRPRGSRSLASHLKGRLRLDAAKLALVHELLAAELLQDLARLAPALKALPLQLTAARPIAEAISTAGGLRLESLDDALMLRSRPGVFCAGEMLDWEAPTGGYLLQAAFASGRLAGEGAAAWWRGARA